MRSRRDRHASNYLIVPPPPPYQFWMTDELRPLHGKMVEWRRSGRPRNQILSDDDFVTYHRERGLRDLYFFTKYICGFNAGAGGSWLEAPLHVNLSWAWQRPNGDRENGIVYGAERMGLMPRASLKSTLLTQGMATWVLVRDPEERILIYSANFTGATLLMTPIKQLLEGQGQYAPLFHACYGDRLTPSDRVKKKWTEDMLTVKRSGNFTDPSIRASGVGSTITLAHFTWQFVDDVVGDELSRSQMDKVCSSVDNLTTMYSSLAEGQRRVAGTRWAFFDPYSKMEDLDPNILVALRTWCEKDGRPSKEYVKENLIFSHFDVKKALMLKKSNPYFFSCNPGEAPVLMADWTEKPIRDVKPGDKVLGWVSGKGMRRRLVETVVEKTQSHRAMLQRVVLSSGAALRCTPDHRWLRGKKNGYAPARVNSQVTRVVDSGTPPFDKEAAAWLATNYERVTSIEPLYEEQVYALQTGTGNYVVWGLASANCQMENNPRDEEKLGFKRSWFRYARRVGDYLVDLDLDGKEERKVKLADCNIFVLVDPNTGRQPGTRTADGNIRKKVDYCGVIVLGVSPDNTWYVLRVYRKRWSVDRFVDESFALMDIWPAKWMAIETRSAQVVFFNVFRERFRAGKKPFTLVEWPGGADKKEELIKALQSRYSNGMIRHLQGSLDVNEGTAILEEELEDFPNAEYDDASNALGAATYPHIVFAPGDTPRLRDTRSEFENDMLKLDFGSQRTWRTREREKEAIALGLDGDWFLQDKSIGEEYEYV